MRSTSSSLMPGSAMNCSRPAVLMSMEETASAASLMLPAACLILPVSMADECFSSQAAAMPNAAATPVASAAREPFMFFSCRLRCRPPSLRLEKLVRRCRFVRSSAALVGWYVGAVEPGRVPHVEQHLRARCQASTRELHPFGSSGAAECAGLLQLVERTHLSVRFAQVGKVIGERIGKVHGRMQQI